MKCEECQRRLNLLNKIFIRITGVPFTYEPCPLKVIDDYKRAKREEEEARLETKIFLKQLRYFRNSY